jgi:hypothetical protein
MPPNSTAPITALSGSHVAKMTRAMAIHPLPAVIPSVHPGVYASERCAPPKPTNIPLLNKGYTPPCTLVLGAVLVRGIITTQIRYRHTNNTTVTSQPSSNSSNVVGGVIL